MLTERGSSFFVFNFVLFSSMCGCFRNYVNRFEKDIIQTHQHFAWPTGHTTDRTRYTKRLFSHLVFSSPSSFFLSFSHSSNFICVSVYTLYQFPCGISFSGLLLLLLCMLCATFKFYEHQFHKREIEIEHKKPHTHTHYIS